MSQLGYKINHLIKKHRGGSFATRTASKRILNQVANELINNGFKLKAPNQLKPKHIEFLVTEWKRNELSSSTIKNRMSELRWLSRVIGKQNIVHNSNDSYSIGKRVFVGPSKAKELDMSRFQNVRDVQTRYSLLLQSHFGLRRAESILFNVAYADRGDYIRLKRTWTKGGKAREIAIKTPEQKALMSELHQKFGAKSLIASNRNFKEQLKIYEYETSRVGLDRNHGLRHQFAQARFSEISGYKCPNQGGPSRRDMTDFERQTDNHYRKILSKELGHERTQITSVYIGT